MVFYQDDLEDVYLQSIAIVVAYNKLNHYTATKVISQEQFQSWKVEQSCLLGQSFIKSAYIVNKHFVSDEISGKLAVYVYSLKQLLNLFAMAWTEGAVRDQPLGPIFHVPHPSGQPTMTSHTIPPFPLPSPTPIFPPFSTKPPYKKRQKSWDCEVCKKHFTRSNDLRDHKVNVHKMANSFICLICSRTYTNKRNLDKHIKNKHENTYKYTF